MALVVLLLVLPPFAAASVVLQQPGTEWDWEPSPAHISEHCLPVPSVPGEYYNSTVTWRNNSRLLYLAVPEGKPPPGGWPVLVDLLTVDYPAGLYGQRGLFRLTVAFRRQALGVHGRRTAAAVLPG